MRLWTAAPPFDKWFGMLTILSLSKEGGEEGFSLRCLYNYGPTNIDGLVKSLVSSHPGESRGPEHVEITGFRLSPE